MDTRKIAVGGAFWFAGIVVPVLQHALLFIAAGNGSDRGQSMQGFYLNSLYYFYRLPLITWVYLAMMWAVGTLLIISGITHGAKLPAER